jgi:heme-degrading monooxygenase HmoA
LIVRTWTGWTASTDAVAYERYMHRMALPSYAGTEGNRGVLMVKRPAGPDRTEFLMITLWDSMDAVRAFAGDEPVKAVFFPEDESYLVEREWEVSHYEVYGSTLGLGDDPA